MADYNFAGDIDIEQITIVGQYGEVFNITEMFLECNIYQNIFKHYLECDIVISDAININRNLLSNDQEMIPVGFKGYETLVISYRERTDPSEDARIPLKRHIFGIYEISDRGRDTEGAESYVISGISLEAYQSVSTKISKGYGNGGGNSVANMVRSVIKEYVLSESALTEYNNLGIEKTITIDETSGKDSYVIPNYSIDQTLEFFCKEADSKEHYPYFVFYENSKGYNFRNIPKLIQDGEIDFTYHYYPMNYDQVNTGDDIENDDQYKIISYVTLKENNSIENIKDGMFKSKSIGIDILRKRKLEKVFDYEKEYEHFYTQNGGKYNREIFGDPVINVDYTRFGHDNDSIFKEKQTAKKDILIKNRRTSYHKQIFNNIIEVTIPGDSSKNVGELIDLAFYINNDIEDTKYELDKTISGQYLITKVRQQMSPESLTTILECSKDSAMI